MGPFSRYSRRDHLQVDVSRSAQDPHLANFGPALSPPHLRQLYTASVLTQSNAATASAAVSLGWMDQNPAPKLPAPVANAAAAVHSSSRQQMTLALQKNTQYMHSVHVIREVLGNASGVRLVPAAPEMAHLDDAHVRTNFLVFTSTGDTIKHDEVSST